MSTELITKDGDDTSDLSPQDYIAILRRRKTTVLYVAVTIAACAFIYACIAPKTYHATAKVLVDPPSMTVSNVDTNDPLSSLFNIGQQQAVDTQVQELQTAPLLAATQKLAGKAKITIEQIDATNVIAVSADSHIAQTSADAANTLVALYMQENLHNDLRDILAARDFAAIQQSLARQSMDKSEKQLLKFSQAHNITDLEKERDYVQTQFGTQRSLLQSAQDDLLASQAQAESFSHKLDSLPQNTESHLAETNPAIASLEEQISQAETQRSGMTQQGGYSMRAPQVRVITGQINSMRQRLAQEPRTTTSISSAHNTVWDTVQSQLATAQAAVGSDEAKIAAINGQIEGLKSKLQTLSALEYPYTSLERQHQQAVDADNLFTQKITDLDLRQQARHGSEHVIESATVPDAPVYPDRPLIVMFGIALGLFVGIVSALLIEFFDDRLNSPEDGERALGLAALGRIPVFSIDDLQMLAKLKGRRPEIESYKTFRTNLYFCSVDDPIRTVLLTSACPGEGKTTTAINFAFAVATDEKEVILVDTDLRLPSIHTKLGISQGPGLTDVLLGKASLDNVLTRLPGTPNIRVITAGTPPPNPSELLNSKKFKALIEELSRRADMVICDGAPVLPVADSQIVSSIVDATVMVVSNGETKKADARRARILLDRARARIVGIAYNKTVGSDPGYYQYTSHPELKEVQPQLIEAKPEFIESSLNGHRDLSSQEVVNK